MEQKEQTKCMGSDGMQKMNGVINADLMTVEEIHQKLDAGYKDMENGRVREARKSLQNFDSSMKQNKCERGKKMQVVIEIPKEVLYDTKQTIEQATDFAKSVTALGFYKQYGVSVELCSQVAGITEKEFLSEVKRSFIG